MSQWDTIYGPGVYQFAAAFSKLFWPEFIEVEGCVLLVEHYEPENFREWHRKFQEDRQQIEWIINHLHIYDLFLNDPSPKDLEVEEMIAQTLLKCWACALADAFPDRRFTFYYATEPEDYGPTISLYQEA